MVMDYLTYFKRLNYLKIEIEKGRVESPRQMANKFDCSEKTIRNMINRLRDEGLNITYCKKQRRYNIIKTEA